MMGQPEVAYPQKRFEDELPSRWKRSVVKSRLKRRASVTPLMAGDFFDCSQPLLTVGFCTSVVTKGGIKLLSKKSRW